MSRWLLVVILLIVGGVVGGALVTRAQVLAAPEQPIAYSHRVHVEAGVQCLFCHSDALRSSIAGIPSLQKCMGCHTAIATEGEDVQALAAYWERNEPIPWNRVNRQPDFVYFSHEPHLGAALNCETCHGDVGRMDAARPVVKMDMGWCLDCHEQQSPARVAHLVDCLTCHK